MCGPGVQRRVAAVGAAVGACMVLMKVLPFVPGHFNGYEWLALSGWITSGLLLGRRGTKTLLSS